MTGAKNEVVVELRKDSVHEGFVVYAHYASTPKAAVDNELDLLQEIHKAGSK